MCLITKEAIKQTTAVSLGPLALVPPCGQELTSPVNVFTYQLNHFLSTRESKTQARAFERLTGPRGRRKRCAVPVGGQRVGSCSSCLLCFLLLPLQLRPRLQLLVPQGRCSLTLVPNF